MGNSVNCPTCNSTNLYKSFIDSASGIPINVCGDCYMVYQAQSDGINYYGLECRLQEDFLRHSRDVASYIIDFCDLPSNVHSVLEIGSHTDLTLSCMSPYLPQEARLCGLGLPDEGDESVYLDASAPQIIYDNCIDSKGVAYLKDLLPYWPYDFIFCRHTLEHFPSPIRAVHNTYNLLSDNGVAFFEVPSFLWTEVNGVPLYHPEHLSYFTRETLANLFTDNGFKVLKLKESKYWGNIKIMVCKRDLYSLPKRLKTRNPMKIKNLYKLLHPFFILQKKLFPIHPNA